MCSFIGCKNIKRMGWLAGFVLSLILAGCGGGGSGPTLSGGKTGVLVDSPVVGIHYECQPSGKNGTTGSGGEYDYSLGDTVTFSIGDIVFPSAAASAVVTVLDLAGVTRTTDTAAVNIARLLQSLDDDGDISEAITITETRIAELTGLTVPAIDFESSSFDAELAEVVSVTGVSLVTEAAAIDHLTTELAALPAINDTPDTLVDASITVDGSADDWAGIVPVAIDPHGDQSGNSSTDLVSLSAAMDGENMVLLMETAGAIVMPHTPSQDFSHYEVGIHSFSDSNCENQIGFIIANNFTDSGGMNYHQLDSYLTGVSSAETVTAYQTNYLETSFNATSFLNRANSFSFNPYIQSFMGGVSMMHDDLSSDSKCYVVSSSTSGGASSTVTDTSIVGAWDLSTGWSSTAPGMLVFYENGFYIHWQGASGSPDFAPAGVEYGTYSYDGITLISSPLLDENGVSGLSDTPSVNVSISGDTLDFGSGAAILTRVDGGADSLVGAWDFGASTTDPFAIVFYSNGFYIHWQEANGDPACQTGVEYGTYTHSNAGGLSVNVLLDQNGECGASHNSGVTEFSVSGDVLTITENGQTDTANRLVGSGH